jgi:hypothetical protein
MMDTNLPADTISHEAIARRAYERFVARGYQHGHDREDWLAAEADLRVELERSPQGMSRKTVRPRPAAQTRANKTSRRS